MVSSVAPDITAYRVANRIRDGTMELNMAAVPFIGKMFSVLSERSRRKEFKRNVTFEGVVEIKDEKGIHARPREYLEKKVLLFKKKKTIVTFVNLNREGQNIAVISFVEAINAGLPFGFIGDRIKIHAVGRLAENAVEQFSLFLIEEDMVAAKEHDAINVKTGVYATVSEKGAENKGPSELSMAVVPAFRIKLRPDKNYEATSSEFPGVIFYFSPDLIL